MNNGNVSNLGIVSLRGSIELGCGIDRWIVNERRRQGFENTPETFIIPITQDRFANGEGKIILNETARSRDIYIISDIGNHSCRYQLYGRSSRMGPDEHFQDIKRAVAAIGGKAARVSVVMPMLYAARQDRNKGRESLDCAVAMQELERMGVKEIITFDVHNPTIQNAVPLVAFENLYATEQIVSALVADESEMIANPDNMLVISPDLGGMERAIYYSTILNVNIGMFYKRRDYTKVEMGRNPILQHDYIGQDVSGKDVVIIDDMIASGESMVGIINELKGRGAAKVFVVATFAMFTKGNETFEKLYADGMLTRVYTTNLTYAPEEIVNAAWFRRVDLAPFTASVINNLNLNTSIADIVTSTGRLTEMIKELRE